MRNEMHIIIRHRCRRLHNSMMPMLVAGVLVVSAGAFAQQPPVAQGQGIASAAYHYWTPQVQPPPQTQQPQGTGDGQSIAFSRLLAQLQQQTRQLEAVLRQDTGETVGRERLPFAELQDLDRQIRALGPQSVDFISLGPVDSNAIESSNPTQVQRRLDERQDQLTRQRDQLQGVIQRLETQIQQLQAGREEDRSRLQEQLDESRRRTQNLDTQLAELRRERLRADYQAALQAREQARQEQARAQEQAQRTSETADQIAGLSAQLKQLQEQAQRTQLELEQLQDRDGPRARELEKALEGVRQQVQATQDRLRAMERERTTEKVEAASRQRQALESYVQELGRRQEESLKGIEAARQELRAVQERMRQMEQQTRVASEEAAKRGAEQQGLNLLRTEMLRQQEELRNQIRGVDERLKAVTERTGTGTEALRKDLDRFRTDLQRMGQTLGRIERERLDAQAAQKDRLQQLDNQISELRKDLMLVQGSLNLLLSQMGRSTVGSTGTSWGW